jgi:hypothetical protein
MTTSWRPLRLNPHLGSAVSALVDGQLDEESAERAWAHTLRCSPCRRQVEREGWVKRQLAQMAGSPVDQAHDPSERFVGSLLDLGPVAEAWADVEELEHRGRGRRRAGIALVGAGSVSAAVFGLSTLSGAPLGIGGSTAGPTTPATSLSGGTSSTPTPAVVAPAAQVHGRLRGWTLGTGDDGVAHARAVGDRR